MQLQAALKETQLWQQSPVGREWSLVGGEVRTGKIEGDCWYTAISMSSVPLDRNNYLHLDNAAGAGLGCVEE